MKKSTALLAACMTFACAAASCGENKTPKENSISESVTENVTTEAKEEKYVETEIVKTEPETEPETEAEPETESETEAEPETEAAAMPSTEDMDAAARELAGKYLKSIAEDADADAVASIMYPSQLFESLKKEGDLREKIFGDIDYKGGVKVTDLTIKSCESLGPKSIIGAEAYYERYSDVFFNEKLDITVLDGRELEVEYTVDDGVDSESASDTYVVVRTKEEGFKLIPVSSDSLERLAD